MNNSKFKVCYLCFNGCVVVVGLVAEEIANLNNSISYSQILLSEFNEFRGILRKSQRYPYR